MLFVGDDWAEDHHDVEVQDEAGRRLGKARLPEGVAGISRVHELIGRHVPADANPDQVVIGIETDRGPWVRALIAAGYQVIAVNPLQAARYRERHSTSGAKSDAGTVNDPTARTSHEIDGAVFGHHDSEREILLALGEAKWNTTMGISHLQRLDHIRSLLPTHTANGDSPRLLCFSGAGFTPELHEAAAHDHTIQLIDLQRLYHGE